MIHVAHHFGTSQNDMMRVARVHRCARLTHLRTRCYHFNTQRLLVRCARLWCHLLRRMLHRRRRALRGRSWYECLMMCNRGGWLWCWSLGVLVHGSCRRSYRNITADKLFLHLRRLVGRTENAQYTTGGKPLAVDYVLHS